MNRPITIPTAILCGWLLLLGAGACKSSPQPADDAATESAASSSEPKEAGRNEEAEASEEAEGSKNAKLAREVTNVVRVRIKYDSLLHRGEEIVALEEGRARAADKRGGERGMKIDPLDETLRDRVETIRGRRNQPEFLVAASPQIPYRTLAEVVFTAGQARAYESGGWHRLATAPPNQEASRTHAVKIYAPELAVGPPEAERDQKKKPVNLTVAISDKGFQVAAKGAVLPARDGCPKHGPTFCLSDSRSDDEDAVTDVSKLVERARAAYAAGKIDEGRKLLDRALAAYDFAGLYELLSKLEEQHPETSRINVTTDNDMPVEFILELVEYEDLQSLFPRVVLSIIA